MIFSESEQPEIQEMTVPQQVVFDLDQSEEETRSERICRKSGKSLNY